ncbi:hypothetical protein ACVWZM_005269 [Bradyrhizobium sp. USDA 4501]
MLDFFRAMYWKAARSLTGQISDDELRVKLRRITGASTDAELQRRNPDAVQQICLVNFTQPGVTPICIKNLNSNDCTAYGTALGGTGQIYPGNCPPNSRPYPG